MPEEKQTLATHTRWDPPYHFFAVPVILIGLGLAIWNMIQNPGYHSAFVIVFFLAVVLVTLKTRLNALKVQDRVIRLEERLRLSSLASEPLRSRIGELSEGQLVALRFASDAEAPALAEKALSANMSAADIKKAIVNWRPDNFRV